MGKNFGIKLAAIAALLLFCLYGIFGIPKGGLKQSFQNRIHLGLDLQGGIHLVLQVHAEEAIVGQTDADVAHIEADLVKAGVTGVNVGKTDTTAPNTIVISGVATGKGGDVKPVLTSTSYASYDVTSTPDGFRMTMKPSAIRDLEARTLDVSVETIRERIDKLGVAEPLVQPYNLGANQILVELPGIDDPSHVEDIIQSSARLEIHAVAGGPYATDQDALTALNNVIPPDSILLHGTGSAAGGDQVWLMKRVSEVAGTDFRDAQPGTDENNRPNIRFTLTTDAGERFYKYTSAHTATSADPGRMAIVLDNKVREVAGINSAIRDSGEITGGFTTEQAKDLSLMLRTGALPVGISYLETRTVGPSLGAASIRHGVTAAIAGLLAVMIFMLVYYKGAGINADLALVLNLIFLLAFMGFFGATLTLPGIAGVILTVGMGVDSNVLIFERIREELRMGKSAVAAVQSGFAHAWTTIVDTHVTTIVSAAILYIVGSGPVKGFAVTLTIGLVANVITAVFISRLIFDYGLSKRDRNAVLSI